MTGAGLVERLELLAPDAALLELREPGLDVFWPRSDASTSSLFCWAVNFRYVRLLNVFSISLSGLSSEASRTEETPASPAPPSQREIRDCQQRSGVQATARRRRSWPVPDRVLRDRGHVSGGVPVLDVDRFGACGGAEGPLLGCGVGGPHGGGEAAAGVAYAHARDAARGGRIVSGEGQSHVELARSCGSVLDHDGSAGRERVDCEGALRRGRVLVPCLVTRPDGNDVLPVSERECDVC